MSFAKLLMSLVGIFAAANLFATTEDLGDRYQVTGIIAEKGRDSLVMIFDEREGRNLFLHVGDVLPDDPNFKIASIDRRFVTVSNGVSKFMLRPETFAGSASGATVRNKSETAPIVTDDDFAVTNTDNESDESLEDVAAPVSSQPYAPDYWAPPRSSVPVQVQSLNDFSPSAGFRARSVVN